MNLLLVNLIAASKTSIFPIENLTCFQVLCIYAQESRPSIIYDVLMTFNNNIMNSYGSHRFCYSFRWLLLKRYTDSGKIPSLITKGTDTYN